MMIQLNYNSCDGLSLAVISHTYARDDLLLYIFLPLSVPYSVFETTRKRDKILFSQRVVEFNLVIFLEAVIVYLL